MSDNDGIDDALRNAAQLTGGMLARLGEAQSRASQQHAIDQEHAVTAASARAEHQISQAAAQEQAAMARLRLVHDPNWWAAATVRQVSDTWQIADAYRGRQDADAAREIMTREITTHWGVTPQADADAAVVRRLLEQTEQDRQQERAEDHRAEHDRRRGRAIEDEADDQDRQAQRANRPAELRSETVTGTDEVVEAKQTRIRAEGLDQQSADGYDSAEQRDARAEGYARSGDQRATQARILADEGNALPPEYATRTRPGRRRRSSHGPHQPRPYYRIVGDRGR
ncbi:hypothetical protein brsh051_20190 [Brooklawnia propionicigenes]|uniref:Colicin import membrane protein n=1 Tax=Brooklawnia propionicigenes TaxID=3041175 RepID=A0AAN0KGL5_9ACTN|nr:hypothetical protein [Brooklawnia sp. SH051]BEH02738.1 hypothetical protein brsh051_20190 [Brooklawnia sp. SH051]